MLETIVIPLRCGIVVHHALGQQVVRGHILLAPRAIEIEGHVEHFPHVDIVRATDVVDRDQRLNKRPLLVGEVGGRARPHGGDSVVRFSCEPPHETRVRSV